MFMLILVGHDITTDQIASKMSDEKRNANMLKGRELLRELSGQDYDYHLGFGEITYWPIMI